ncbi:MAG: hypothetical protein H7Y02_04065, partial [Candidatus Obscuribacterales bacterium]|nr:hypothetical protein [Steroidobacteraceae bacterium]
MRVFVTGVGAVSCVGNGVAALEHALYTGSSGIAPAGCDWLDLPPQAVVGLVKSAPPTLYPRADFFLEAALHEAFGQAALVKRVDRLPIYLGAAHGHLDMWRRQRQNVATSASKNTASENPAAANSQSNNLWDLGANFFAERVSRAEVTVVSTACTASSVAVGLALDTLRCGDSEIAVVAGVEAMTSFLYSGFASLRSLASACRPFDRDRSGLVLGEGAAAIVLETEAHAQRRGATPLAELAGFGFASDALQLTAPDPAGAGATAALQAALSDARMNEPPDYVNAHGTGTKLNDHMECVALRRVFRDNVTAIPISSTKPITGHLCGGAGAMEVVASIIGMRAGIIPPVLGLENPDLQFANFDFVRGQS